VHEASLMADVLRRIETVAAIGHAGRVTGVAVWLGALSHLSPEHFTEHFVAASHGTIVEGAALRITASDDLEHAAAQHVLIESVEVES
jgi:hydrogenase nickel incorporation protein HypA/HybF